MIHHLVCLHVCVSVYLYHSDNQIKPLALEYLGVTKSQSVWTPQFSILLSLLKRHLIPQFHPKPSPLGKCGTNNPRPSPQLHPTWKHQHLYFDFLTPFGILGRQFFLAKVEVDFGKFGEIGISTRKINVGINSLTLSYLSKINEGHVLLKTQVTKGRLSRWSHGLPHHLPGIAELVSL